LIRKVPNPYKEDWNNFDIEEFKEDIGFLIEELVLAETKEEKDAIMDTIDDHLIYLSILLVYKDEDEVDVIRLSDIPEDQMKKAGIDFADLMMDGGEYMPVKQLEELFDIKIKVREIDTDGWRI
jgi:hypothetical protein